MKSRQPALPCASDAIRAMGAGPFLVAALCLAGALVVFLAYPAYARSGDETSAPSNLTAAIADSGVILNWSPPVQDAASVTGYEILRRRPKASEGTLSRPWRRTPAPRPPPTWTLRRTSRGHATSTGSRRFAAARRAPDPTTPASTSPRKPMRRNRRRVPRPEA